VNLLSERVEPGEYMAENSLENPLETEDTVVDDIQSITDSGLGNSVSSQRGGFNSRSKRDSCGDWGVTFGSPRIETPDLENIFEERELESVLIGTALGRDKSSGGKGESREARIERMKREREEEFERRRIREESGRWVGELKDVLGRRRRE